MPVEDKVKRRAAITALAVAVAAPAEGLRRTYYYDPPGILTVCYGHTGKDISKTKVYSIEECKALMGSDMASAIDTVERCVPGLPVHVVAAFADAVYNMGPTIACDTQQSTAARLLKIGSIEKACNQLPRWDKAKVAGVLVALPGLTKRRLVEQKLCLTGEFHASYPNVPKDSGIQQVLLDYAIDYRRTIWSL